MSAPAGGHAAVVAQLVGEIVPAAEVMAPLLKKELGARLRAGLDDVERRAGGDAVAALGVYGIRLPDSQRPAVEKLVAANGAWARERLDGLLLALNEGRDMAMAGFVNEILASMLPAMAAATGQRGAGQLDVLLRGDAALRLLVAFLEQTRAVLGDMKPQKPAAARARKKKK